MAFSIYVIYVPLVVVLAVYMVQALQSSVIKYKLGVYAFLICVFLMIGLRSLEVGNDTWRYFEEFENSVHDLKWGGRGGEIGFTYILSFFKWAGTSFQIFNIAYSFLIVYAVFSIYKSGGFQLSFVVIGLFYSGYFFMSMSGMRQMFAVSLFLLSCYAPKSIVDVFLKLILFAIAVLNHNTSLIGVPILVITVLQANELTLNVKRGFILMLIVSVILTIKFIEFESIIELTKLGFYSNSEEFRPLSFPYAIFWICISIVGGYAAISNYKYAGSKHLLKLNSHQMKVFRNNNKYSVLIYVYSGVITAVAFYIGLAIPLMDRFSYYFQPFIFGAIGIYISNIRIAALRWLGLLVVNIVGLIFMTRLLLNDPFGLLG